MLNEFYNTCIDQRNVKMPIVTLSSKFQISIPKEVRDTLDLKPGQRLAFLCIGKSVKLVPQPRIEDLFGIGKGANPDGYRDRGSRRDDSFSRPKPSSSPIDTPAKSKRAA
jgi:AbrB family looped-hinge helix DNA binding protein